MEKRNFKMKQQILEAEYYTRVQHDFSRYLFLGVRSDTLDLTSTIAFLCTRCEGYEAHRVIRYKGEKAVHMYVRFRNGQLARKAISAIKAKNPLYVTEYVGNLLSTWYIFEILYGSISNWTNVVLDTVGSITATDPLSEDVIKPLLQKFGDFHIYAAKYSGNAASQLEVSMPSMAEALGASIAHGEWLRGTKLEKGSFYYRIRLVGSSKESELLENCGSFTDAFDLDYFVDNYVPVNPCSVHDNITRAPYGHTTQRNRKYDNGRDNRPFGRGRPKDNRPYLRRQYGYPGNLSQDNQRQVGINENAVS